MRLATEIISYTKTIALFGLSQTARAAFIAAINQVRKRQIVVLTKDERSANRIHSDIEFFGDRSQVFSQRDLTLRPLESFSREYEYRRIKTLGNLVGGKCDIVISPIDAALMYTIPKEQFIKNTLTIKSTTVIKQQHLLENLLNAGYVRRDMVEGPGQVAVRGDIMDLYTPDMANPVRIEFWGDEIDRINTFDIESQRRLEQIKKVHISPVKEVLFTSTQQAIDAIEQGAKGLSAKQKQQYDIAVEKDLITLNDGMMPSAMDKYISLCYEKVATLFDYLENTIIYIDDHKAVRVTYSNLT